MADDQLKALRAQLQKAERVIAALTDRVESGTGEPDAVSVFEAAARMEQTIASRTAELETRTDQLRVANEVLRKISDNLDRVVKQRTRALIESEAQLRRKNEELEQQSALKLEFISVAAHELRTPLTSMVGYLDLVEEGRFGEIPAPMRKPIAAVRRNAHRLRRLVGDLLDISRIESGRVRLRYQDCALVALSEAVADELRPLAETKEQSLSIEADAEVTVTADRDKIHQVVFNLVSNSIRYTENGGSVSIHVDHPAPDEYGGTWSRLTVKDTGIGISKDAIGQIFEPFSDLLHTAKHHTSAGPDSAGLGLYIARGLVDLHGGVITVASTEGEGSEFTVLLPNDARNGERRGVRSDRHGSGPATS